MINDILAALKAPVPMGHTIPTLEFLDTSSTCLNLALSGNPWGGIAKGSMVWWVGDSQSGKTWLAHGLMAEAARNPQFKDYRLVFDDGEKGALFDIVHYFGQALADRIEPPRGTRANPQNSVTAEELYFNLWDNCVDHEQPCIYVRDSMDSLTSSGSEKKFIARKQARGTAKKVAGDYGDGKAKINSEGLRIIVPELPKNGSIFIAISQTRDNIDAMSMEKQTAAGGRALKFYADVEIWTKPVGQLKRTVRDIPRVIGNNTRISIKKNRYQGKRSQVEVPIYYSYGVDDIGSCIDFLVAEQHWSKNEKGTKVNAPDFNFVGSTAKLIEKIEAEGLEKDLRSVVGDVWAEVEEETKLERKPRYR